MSSPPLCDVCGDCFSLWFCPVCRLSLCRDGGCDEEIHKAAKTAGHKRESIENKQQNQPTQKAEEAAESSTAPLCEVCEDSNASLACLACSQDFCAACDAEFHKPLKMQGHIRKPREQEKQEKTEIPEKKKEKEISQEKIEEKTKTPSPTAAAPATFSSGPQSQAHTEVVTADVVLCDTCEEFPAVFHCPACLQSNCPDCDGDLHKIAKFASHKRNKINGEENKENKENKENPETKENKPEEPPSALTAAAPAALETPKPVEQQEIQQNKAEKVEEKTEDYTVTTLPAPVPDQVPAPVEPVVDSPIPTPVVSSPPAPSIPASTPSANPPASSSPTDEPRDCEVCDDSPASLECSACDQIFCQACDGEFHKPTKMQNHKRNKIRQKQQQTTEEKTKEPVKTIDPAILNPQPAPVPVPASSPLPPAVTSATPSPSDSSSAPLCETCEDAAAVFNCATCEQANCAACDGDLHKPAKMAGHKRRKIGESEQTVEIVEKTAEKQETQTEPSVPAPLESPAEAPVPPEVSTISPDSHPMFVFPSTVVETLASPFSCASLKAQGAFLPSFFHHLRLRTSPDGAAVSPLFSEDLNVPHTIILEEGAVVSWFFSTFFKADGAKTASAHLKCVKRRHAAHHNNEEILETFRNLSAAAHRKRISTIAAFYPNAQPANPTFFNESALASWLKSPARQRASGIIQQFVPSGGDKQFTLRISWTPADLLVEKRTSAHRLEAALKNSSPKGKSAFAAGIEPSEASDLAGVAPFERFATFELSPEQAIRWRAQEERVEEEALKQRINALSWRIARHFHSFSSSSLFPVRLEFFARLDSRSEFFILGCEKIEWGEGEEIQRKIQQAQANEKNGQNNQMAASPSSRSAPLAVAPACSSCLIGLIGAVTPALPVHVLLKQKISSVRSSGLSQGNEGNRNFHSKESEAEIFFSCARSIFPLSQFSDNQLASALKQENAEILWRSVPVCQRCVRSLGTPMSEEIVKENEKNRENFARRHTRKTAASKAAHEQLEEARRKAAQTRAADDSVAKVEESKENSLSRNSSLPALRPRSAVFVDRRADLLEFVELGRLKAERVQSNVLMREALQLGISFDRLSSGALRRPWNNFAHQQKDAKAEREHFQALTPLLKKSAHTASLPVLASEPKAKTRGLEKKPSVRALPKPRFESPGKRVGKTSPTRARKVDTPKRVLDPIGRVSDPSEVPALFALLPQIALKKTPSKKILRETPIKTGKSNKTEEKAENLPQQELEQAIEAGESISPLKPTEEEKEENDNPHELSYSQNFD